MGSEGTILKWDPSTWARQQSGTKARFFGVWGSDAHHLWAVEWNGTILGQRPYWKRIRVQYLGEGLIRIVPELPGLPRELGRLGVLRIASGHYACEQPLRAPAIQVAFRAPDEAVARGAPGATADDPSAIYLSRLRAGDGVPSASLVSLLVLLGKEPARLDELARYWALPLVPEPRARRRRQGP